MSHADETPADRVDALEGWLAHRRWWVAAGIVLLSLTVRAPFFLQFSRGPCSSLVRWEQTDMHAFDAWARAIVAGDLLSRDPPYPLHRWHLEVARALFREHPEVRDELGPSGRSPADEREAARRLWDRWCGGGRFYQDPLYPYLLAGIYATVGHHPAAVVLFQMLLGTWINLLLLGLGRRLFSETAGAAAALLGGLSAPLLFYEALLLRATAISFAGLGLAWLLARALERRRRGAWFAAGLAVGVSLWLRASFLLVALGGTALLVVRHRKDPRTGLVVGGAALAGLVLGFAPVIVRNVVVGAPPLQTASAGGVNFALGDSSDSRMENAFFSYRHVAPILYKSGGRLLPSIRATLRTHPSAAGYPALVAHKLALAWKAVEVPNNASFAFCRMHDSVLRLLPVTFLVVGPLGLLGLLLAAPIFRRAAPLYLVAATQLAVLLVFFVFSRYRAPLYAALLPFAGLTVERAWTWAARRKWVRLALLVVAAVVLATWSARTPQGLPDPVRVVDHAVALRYHYALRAEQAVNEREPERAIAVWEEALRFEPPSLRGIGPDRPPRDAREAKMADLYNGVRYRYAQVLESVGRTDEAERQRRIIRTRLDAVRRFKGFPSPRRGRGTHRP